MALQRLKEAAEKAKIELCSTLETEINLPFLTADAGRPEAPRTSGSRARSSRIWSPTSSNARWAVQQALEDAGLKPSEIDEVILVGGSTRIPKVETP